MKESLRENLETFVGRVTTRPREVEINEAEARIVLHLLDAAKKRIEDFQCAHRSDGPRDDCPCTYCVLGMAILAMENPRD